MNICTSTRCFFSLAALLASMVVAPTSQAVTVTEITPYDATTFWNVAPTAGLDFDDGTSSNYPDPTQAGFLGVPASNNKTYDLVHNGITFDIDVSFANQANQNRNRNNANAGALVTDFEQWFGNTGTAPEASFVFGGLLKRTDYDISFFTYNVGAGQTTHNFYDGTSSADPLLTTFLTSGNQNNYATWKPGVMFSFHSGSSTEYAITIQAVGERVTLDGVAVQQGATIPEPSSLALLGLGLVSLFCFNGQRRRR